MLANNLNKIKKFMANKSKKSKNKKPIVVAVSGGFDPLHVGHVRMFREAKKHGDKLVVILNNDNWLKKKKGFAFMPEKERKELIRHIKWVDDVVLTGHKPNDSDRSVCRELHKLKPHVFANGGDRKLDNIPEVAVCEKHGIKMVFNIGHGGKIQSSSWLLNSYMGEAACICGSGKKYKDCHGKKKKSKK